MDDKNSLEKLILQLTDSGILKTREIIDAFRKVDRKDFVKDPAFAYEDIPLSIGSAQTISQPTTVATMIELLDPKKGNSVLDIGSGSGWTTALLADIVGEEGDVTGIEVIPELAEFGSRNLRKYRFPSANILLVDPTHLGLPGQRFDRILVSAAPEVFPSIILEQLERDGILVIPVKHSIYKFTKSSDGRIYEKEYPGYVFVPLIG